MQFFNQRGIFHGSSLKRSVASLAATFALGLPNTIQAGEYAFIRMAVSNDSHVAILSSPPSINNHGHVAFSVNIRDLGGAIYRSNNGSIDTIVKRDETFGAFGEPVINDAGVVVFIAAFHDGSTGIFTSSGGPVTTIADHTGPYNTFPIGHGMNDAGTVVFGSYLDTGAEGIFTGSGGDVTTVVHTSSSRLHSFGGPAINNSGMVVFNATYPCCSAQRGHGIYSNVGGEDDPIVHESGGRFKRFGPPALNDFGTVAFYAQRDFNDRGIFIIKDGDIATIATDPGTFESFLSETVCVNNDETVVFVAWPNDGQQGIFTGPDPLADKVIQVGEPLFGSSLADLRMGRNALNEGGEIAFYYELADGEIGIAVASPTVAADFDRNAHVDRDDLAHFIACSSGPAIPQSLPSCQNADLDDDGDVDGEDFGLFQRCYSGADLRPDPACAG